jgi:hypothetical protein
VLIPSAVKLEPVKYYEERLHDTDFRWDGPCANTNTIPVLHAARALAYIGDPAVPALCRAVRDRSVDIGSVWDALAEIGLPVDEYDSDLRERNPNSIERWWRENGKKTASWRSELRKQIGLPPICPGVAESE